MDIDFLIESGYETISLEEIKISNKNIKLMTINNIVRVIYYGNKISDCVVIPVKKLMSNMGSNGAYHSVHSQDEMKLIMLLELSDLCRKNMTQKFYDKFTNSVSLFKTKLINIIIDEYDLGFIEKEVSYYDLWGYSRPMEIIAGRLGYQMTSFKN